MGRLDDHAKRRIVELRRAGLSFRKIKKVLELDDIRVTPQAVYLFLKRKSVEPGSVAAGWDGEQPWPPLQGHEAEPPRLLGTRHPALPTGDPVGSQAPRSAGSQDTKESIRIVGVASLCEDSGRPGDTLPVGLAPGNGDDSSTGTALAPGTALGSLAPLPQPLPSRGQLITPPTQNSALMVKKKIVDRAILLQKKVKDVSTQTVLPNPMGPGNNSLAWGGAVPTPAPSSPAMAEKLDAVQMEVQKLRQALQAVLERQCHLERQQEQQQRLQQEVLMTLQQLSSTVSHGAVPATQPCGPFGSMGEPSPTMPNFSQFKMELI
ncbi:PREDICTED: polyhomeotic-like protein 1 [Ficedula albicollis]|uniref:polyhomeotic-like protein 1 n=1 Tax=Ficedula albicollis TaxID=59894 RepID=UPI000359EAC4|nr:PREDICTED: polyhomeotic-like protein 1 [Ficedula albicollis]XP_005054295.1 PREDICTED: polyhomeotic-like protein 1 [Ficedula albicollis]